MKESRESTVAESAVDPLIGRVLDGRFRILGLIARGGMGAIYRAEQEPLRRTVALKVLAPNGDAEALEGFRNRFFREASICSRLSHPNTVRIYDYGKTDDGIYFIAMELLQGQTLKQAMDTDAPLAPWRAINLIKQVCASLAEAHGQGLIHRDLKPSNIILTEHADGTEFVNVVDFGLVKDLGGADGDQTQVGMIVGSPMYMSPEQILQSDLTERSDIYSLGIILYGLLTGRKPFKQESALALMNCHLQVQPPPFSQVNPDHEVPASLEWVTHTCLAKDPAARFATVRELSRALTACDMELRGMVSNLQLRLENGRVILPPEVEEHLGRRGAAPTTGSGSFASRASAPSGSVLTGTLNTSPSEPERPAWALPLALVGLVVLGLVSSIAVFRMLVPSGSEQVEERAAAAPPVTAPAEEPPATPPAEPTAGSAAKPAEPSAGSAAKPAAKPAGAPAAKPAAAASNTPGAAPAGAPTHSAPATAVSATPPVVPEKPPEKAPETPPETKNPGDWAQPKSDIKDPWGDK